MLRIYEIKTEQKDTTPGHTYDRFNIAAENFHEAVEKAEAKLRNDWKSYKRIPEKIQAVTILASEG